MKRNYKPNIRIKLIISHLSLVIIAGVGAIFISLHIIDKNILGQAYDEVQSNLNTAPLMLQFVYATCPRSYDPAKSLNGLVQKMFPMPFYWLSSFGQEAKV